MFGSNVLDIGIGLAFLYLLGSLICSALNELISGLLRSRATNLERGLRNLLDGNTTVADGWAARLLSHPLVDGLGKNAEPPSYVPSRTFSTALLSLILDESGEGATIDLHFLKGADAFDAIRAKVKLLNNPVLRGAVLPLIEAARHAWDEETSEVEAVKSQLETWFNDAMDRVGGWYKRKTQTIIFSIALVGALLLNIDSISFAQRLGSNSTLRAQISANASDFVSLHPSSQPGSDKYAAAARALDQLEYPIGWRQGDASDVGHDSLVMILHSPSLWLTKLFGLLLTAGAISFGAPFWFDTLSRIISIRSTGNVPSPIPNATTTPGVPDGRVA